MTTPDEAQALLPVTPFAFPSQPYGSDGLPCCDASPGMDLRDYLAGQAVIGCIMDRASYGVDHKETAATFASAAYAIADAMLVARKEAP